MTNERIRRAARIADVKLWEIAERYGCADATFSRKLRNEFSEEETQKILNIIANIEAERN